MSWYAPLVALFAKRIGRTAEYRSDPDRQHVPPYDGTPPRRSTGLTWMPMSRMGEPVVMQAERWQSVYVIVDHGTYWTAQVRTGPKPLLWLGDVGQLHTMREAMMVCQQHADEAKP
jgi:hypothetical protein